ncbi:MAG TPA: DUF5010 domain-containing protein [Verrucomicrobiae bacterium]|nr:DUF5010 domain-containing protein [Verrucomicrobiae bacterium]
MRCSLASPLRKLILLIACLPIAPVLAGEHPIPPAFGPHIHLTPRDFRGVTTFSSKQRLVGTYYFYWYSTKTGEHIRNPEDGSDGLTDHPPTFDDFSYTSVAWHKKQLADMEAAGIDVALMVFWGAPSEHDAKTSLHWSYAGLGPLIQAREELLREGRHPPRIGLFYDTSTLQYNEWHQHIDLTTDYGRKWFYATIRDFFSMIPPKHWAMIDGKPIVLMYAAAFAKNHDQTFVDYTRIRFRNDFGGREPYLAPQDSWGVKADNTCAWGGAFGLKNPGIGELGPGYNDSAVYGRHPQIVDRRDGAFYEDNWKKFLRRPSNLVMIETWSEFHEGTDICDSREYGRKYIDLTRKYSDLFKRRTAPPWPVGKFTHARAVSLTPSAQDAGLRIVTPEDGPVRLNGQGGEAYWTTAPSQFHGKYIYFTVDDSFKRPGAMKLSLRVEYQDIAPGRLGVEFDGNNLSAPESGAYSPGPRIQLTGDHQWKSGTFPLNGAILDHSENGEADFRLVIDAQDVGVRKVTLERTGPTAK